MKALSPADPATVVLDWLAEHMPADVTVSSTVLTRTRMLRVDVVTSQRSDHVMDVSTVALQAYDDTGADARDLCALAFTTLFDAIGYAHDSGAYVRDVTPVGLPIEFPDPDRDEPRYQATVDVNIRPSTKGVTA